MPRLRLIRIQGKRAYVAASACGAALSFAFPEANLWWLAWVSLVPLLHVLEDSGPGRGARLGFVFGLGFFGWLLHWVSIIGYLGYVVLVLLQAAFTAAFGLVWGASSRWGRGVAYRLLVPAGLWIVFVEYARSVFPLRGFPWGQLAQSQHNATWFLASAGIGGSWLTAGLLVLANGLLLRWIASPRSREALRPLVSASAAFVLVVGVCWAWPRPGASDEPLTVAIVQGNIPRYMQPSYDKDLIIIENHSALTRSLPSDVDLVVWPESSVGVDPFRDESVGESVAAVARDAGVPMVVGGNMEAGDGDYKVMAYLYSPQGEIVDTYQKTHLVPFGEYVPARDLLDFIPALDQVPRDAVPGDRITLFDVDGHKVATAISFEGDFGSLVRERIAAGGRMLIVDTNTSTWGESWASAQHLAMSQVRAAENGVPVVHAALTGISAFVSPEGDVEQRTGLWEGRVLIGEVRPSTGITPYARFGDFVAWGALAAVAGAVSFAYRRGPGTVPA